MTEKLFTEIYEKNLWGSKETYSGVSSTLLKTNELRSQLPEVFEKLNIKSILDCGCGDFHWMKHVSLTNIEYLGVDIVEKLIEKNQKTYTTNTTHFQKMNLLTHPPETADLWIARDFCCLYEYKDIKTFFTKFLESKSKYIAITNIQTTDENIEGIQGSWRPYTFSKAPFFLPDPIYTLKDDTQWFREKTLNIYTREHIFQSKFATASLSNTEVVPLHTVSDKQDRNAHLLSNIPLGQIVLHDRMG